MPITTREARQLSTAGEWTLVQASQADRIRALGPARLKGKIARARTLRDKYRDLGKRQHRKAQPARSGGPYEALNVRTRRKAELFEQVLGRFEAELERQAAQAAKTAESGASAGTRKKTRAGSGTKKKARRGASASKPPRAKVKRTRGPKVPKSAVGTRSGQRRIHAHVASAGRRRQVRRDSRGR
jgi:hypothetical protein